MRTLHIVKVPEAALVQTEEKKEKPKAKPKVEADDNEGILFSGSVCGGVGGCPF